MEQILFLFCRSVSDEEKSFRTLNLEETGPVDQSSQDIPEYLSDAANFISMAIQVTITLEH